MDVKAKAKFIRISPRKARLVVDVVRGLNLIDALSKLTVLNKKAVGPITKLINSASANAKNNNNCSLDNLYIKEITVNEGPILYRWMPRAFGRATKLRKKTSHITVILSEKVETLNKKDAKKIIKDDIIETIKVDDKKDLAKLEKSVDSKEKNNESDKNEKVEDVGKKKQILGRTSDVKENKENKTKGGLKKMFIRRKSGM